MRNREDLEALEFERLAPPAVKAAKSRGRRKPEPEDALRTCFQRDRDRVLHSRTFRRLQRKTQVLLSGSGDHYRTRMSHSIEVSQMARSACLALGLNADLAEAAALAHDLGHPPFGHVGEEVLDRLMADEGGFRHNAQGLRVVDLLEEHGPPGLGLNLCYETRLCLFKKPAPAGFPLAADLPDEAAPYLEGLLVDACDRIAYLAHDLDDALRSGVMDWQDLLDLDLVAEARQAAETSMRREGGQPRDDPARLRHRTAGALVRILIRDLVTATARALDRARPRDPEEARRQGRGLVGQSTERQQALESLLARLGEGFYRHPRIRGPIERSAAVLADLFEELGARPQRLPPFFRSRIEIDGLARSVCDYLAGMTDDFARSLARGRREGASSPGLDPG